jgi:hypothetical protein
MEVAVENAFTVMAEVLPKNERTENILAQRAAADAAKHEKAEQVSRPSKSKLKNCLFHVSFKSVWFCFKPFRNFKL